MEKSDMRRTKLSFVNLIGPIFLKWLLSHFVGGGFPVRSVGGNKGRRRFHRRTKRATHSSRHANNDEEAMLDVLDQTESKSSRRVTKSKTPEPR